MHNNTIDDSYERQNKDEIVDVSFPTFQLIAIFFSALLGLLDMTFLYQAIHNLTGLSNMTSMIAAFAIAEVANFTAFMMGRINGKNLSKHAINKKSFSLFFTWIILGIGYVLIRVFNFIKIMDTDDFLLEGELLQFFILAISYIGTGTTIWSCARVISDKRATEYRKAKKAFEIAHSNVSGAYAQLQENHSNIQNYDMNYKNLESQKRKIEQSILRAEKGAMSDIEGIVLKKNPTINPKDTKQVIKDVLAERKDEDWEVL